MKWEFPVQKSRAGSALDKVHSAPDLLDNPFAHLEDKIDIKIPSGTLQIYQCVGEMLAREESNDVNRASAAPKCVRQNWYKANKFEGKAMAPRVMINLLSGQLGEAIMLYFISEGCVGVGKLYSEISFGEVLGDIPFQGRNLRVYKQKTMSFKIKDGEKEITVTAHIDGMGKRNSDGRWELIECKTAANVGFAKFCEGENPDYLKQAHACMLTDEMTELGVRAVRYFYLRKETGHLWDRAYAFDQTMVETVKQNYLLANGQDAPPPEYDYVQTKAGLSVPWQCSYCGFLKECKGAPETKFKKDYQNNVSKPSHTFTKRKTHNAV